MVRCRSRVLRPACVILWLLSCVYDTENIQNDCYVPTKCHSPSILVVDHIEQEMDAVRIVKLTVPEVVQFGAEDSALLDCDFEYGNDTRGLVLKWFFQSRTRPVYQWIAGHQPQAIGILRGRVDLTHRASADPLTEYRALRIVKLGTDVSGNYTCVASTFMAEDVATKHMTVFTPETSFRLIQNKTDDDTVNVICAADGAFPAPILTLSTPDRRLEGVNQTTELVGDRYSAVAMVTLRDADLPSPAAFVCTLRIAEANYVVRKEAIYYPGPISTTPELPTAADMQLAASAGLPGMAYTLHAALALAQILLN